MTLAILQHVLLLVGAAIVCNVYYTYLTNAGKQIGLVRTIYIIAMMAVPILTVSLVYNVKVLIPSIEVKHKLFMLDPRIITFSAIGGILYIVF